MRCEEVAALQQQILDLRGNALEPLRAERAAMLAALAAVTQLCADWAPAQPPDRAHLMAPAVSPAGNETRPLSITVSSPTGPPGESADAHRAAEAAVEASRHCLQHARSELTALSDGKRIAEVRSFLWRACLCALLTWTPAQGTHELTMRCPLIPAMSA